MDMVPPCRSASDSRTGSLFACRPAGKRKREVGLEFSVNGTHGAGLFNSENNRSITKIHVYQPGNCLIFRSR
jgi:hypothetical protein